LALADFFEQARVVHRDDGLCREVLQEIDLFFAERPHLSSVDRDEASHRFILEQRHDQQCSGTAQLDHRSLMGISRAIGIRVHNIGELDDLLSLQQAGDPGPRSIDLRALPSEFGEWRGAPDRCGMKALAVIGCEMPEARLAQPHGPFEHGVEHGPEMAG